MFKFVDSNSDGLPQKRKQSQRACQRCRKGKRRCEHHEGANALQHTPLQTDTNPLVSSAPSRAKPHEHFSQEKTTTFPINLDVPPAGEQPGRPLSGHSPNVSDPSPTSKLPQ